MVDTRVRSGLPLAAALGMLAASLPALLRSEDGVPAGLTLLVLGAVGLGATALSRHRCRAIILFTCALAFRALAACLIWYWNPKFLSVDQGVYFELGNAMAAGWRAASRGPSLDWLVSRPGNHFAEIWASVSYFVGSSQLALRMATAVVGAYTAVRVYALGDALFGERAGWRAGWITACWPSFIAWSAQGLRDPLLIWMWCEVGLALVRVRRGRTVLGSTGLALAIYGLTRLRPYGAVLAAMGTCLALLSWSLQRLRPVYLAGIAVAGIALLAGGLGPFGIRLVRQANLDTVTDYHERYGGGSDFSGREDVATYPAAARYLPTGLAYFLFSPFPWQAGSPLQMATLLEQPLWYALCFLAAWAALTDRRKRGLEAVAFVALVLPAVLIYAVALPNMGTAYRARAQLVPLLFVWAAHGTLLWQARERRRPVRVCPGTRAIREPA